MNIEVVSRTDVGRVRTNNEDNFLADASMGLYVVCDGMGGHNAGEVASKICCDVIHKEIHASLFLRNKFQSTAKTSDLKALRRAVEDAVQAACKEIYKQANRSTEQAGMGTTCTVLFIANDTKAVLAHVGDSRLYLMRDEAVHQLSEDHTYVGELVKRGALSAEQAKNHPQGNVLSRAMGVQSTVAVDTMAFDYDPGDTLLLCSDGVYNYYQETRELGAFLGNSDLTVSINNVIDRALERGGHDNCTAIICRIQGQTAPHDRELTAHERIGTLKRIPLFNHLGYMELVRLVGLTEIARLRAGSTLTLEGESGDAFFVMLQGEVDVSQNGTWQQTLQPGMAFGELALLNNAPRITTARARTDVSVLVLRRDEFVTLVREEPVLGSKLLWVLSRHLVRPPVPTPQSPPHGAGPGIDKQNRYSF